MYHLYLTRNLRSFVFLLIAAAMLACGGLLWWANRTGLPESWRAGIEREISHHGLNVKIGGLSYLPLRGVVASKVRVFADTACNHEISRLESVVLDFDKTKLARGHVRLNKLVLRDATLSLPVDPDHPERGTLEVSGACGTLLMPGGKRLEVRDARGRIAGIEVSLNARLIGYQKRGDAAPESSDTGKHRAILSRVLKQIEPWRFNENDPPRLTVFLEGNANNSSTLNAKFTLDARYLEKNRHELRKLHAEAEMTGDLLNLTSLHAEDSRGSLNGRLDYDIGQRSGRFDLQSSLEITPLLAAWLEQPAPERLVIGGGQEFLAEGEFHLDEDNKPVIQMTGRAAVEDLAFRDVRFEAVESAFSWNDGRLFLHDFRLSRSDGVATGKVLIEWPLVRMSLHSTLPASVYKPFFTGQPLEIVIDSFKERARASFDIRLEGGFDATDRYSWAYSGGGTVKNVNYLDVPVDSAECRFSLSHHELDFFDGTVVFNYQDYALRNAFKGPKQATCNVSRIRYVNDAKVVEVENVTGGIWAAPLVRLFAPKVADSLEIYRFHQPPELKGSGVVDVTPRGRTALDVSFSSPGNADYVLLGQNVTLSQPSGKVLIRGSRVSVENLKLNVFDGPVSARFDYDEGKLSGETSWTKLSLPALASTYGFHAKGGGAATGRLDFSLTDGQVKSMAGEGLFALEKTELFSVPMFGPLSQLISGLLNDRRAGFERAKSAFCMFDINEGILRIRDFQTSTTSLAFVGDGHVDLSEKTFDMTMRMNARGLLGLLTLPLRPFYGMFQFRGTGPLKEPKWENVMFTTPSEAQREALQSPPKASAVTPEN